MATTHAPEGTSKSEKAILQGILADFGLLLPYAIVALWSGSLTMLADTVRGAIFLGSNAFSLRALRKINRGEFRLYDYGTGKVEQAFGLIVALELVIGGSAFLYKAVERVFSQDMGATDGSLFLAFLLVALNLVLNTWQYIAIRSAGKGEASPIVQSQITARRVKVLSSAIVATAVGVDALAAGTTVAIWSDSLGAAFLGAYMLKVAWGLLIGALPDLLDRTLDEKQQLVIDRHLARHFDAYAEFKRVRSRRAGPVMLIDVELGFPAGTPIGEIQPVLDAMRTGIEVDMPAARVTIIPYAVAP